MSGGDAKLVAHAALESEAEVRRWEAASWRGARLAMLRRNLARSPAERIELMCELSELARELAADGARCRSLVGN